MKNMQCKISGPGFLRATQEAHKAKKTLVIVYDQNKSGKLIRIGYFLEDKSITKGVNPIINWFTPDEISITPLGTENKSSEINARLDIGFIHPRKEQRHMLLSIPIGMEQQLLLRCLFRLNQNIIIDFMIQVELKGMINGKEEWISLIRYDCAHDYIHRDLLYSDGKKTKEKLPTQSHAQAVSYAIDEIGKNLADWLPLLGYNDLDPKLIDQYLEKEDLENAKMKLLNFLNNPAIMDNDNQSHLVIVK